MIQPGTPPRLKKTGSGASHLVLHFPPQAITEETFFETRPAGTTNPPEKSGVPSKPEPGGSEELTGPPVRARISGESRVPFVVPDGFDVPYTLEGVLGAVEELTLSVAANAKPPGAGGRRISLSELLFRHTDRAAQRRAALRAVELCLGSGGIDAALLVIAADEGVMPQTKEHLAILDLLQIPAGLIVLTKTDLASDSGWLDLVETDIRTAVAGTILKDAPIVRVSAKTKTGLEELTDHLQTVLQEKPARPDLNRPRLPVDRVFSMSGFGTVVTGTLSDGHLPTGDEIEVLPGGLRGRIRGLQTHKKKEERAVPGSRTAVNISGVNTEQLQRGDVVAHPNQYQPTRRLDARFRLLKDASSLIQHGQEVKFFVGASETIGILRLLGVEELQPGEEGWLQLELRDQVIAVRGDRYILRRPSPGETLGGGMIVDHQPKGRHKLFDETILKSLESLAQGTPADVLLEAALGMNIASIKELVRQSRLENANAESALRELSRVVSSSSSKAANRQLQAIC